LILLQDTFGCVEGVASGSNKKNQLFDNALKALASNLYGYEHHFVLELIQNAEDNSYAPSARPRVQFNLSRANVLADVGQPSADGVLVLVNNETGFTNMNMEALSAVGKSTKQKQLGYIGEKGIGFKAVFQVRWVLLSCHAI
jgi:HSP90 family molecular chaperone